MNTKDNQRTRLTRMLIRQAYMKLLSEKQTGRITVKEICERAEINRSTFYLHYNEPNDILMELEDETISALREALSTISSFESGSDNARNYLMSFLRYVRKNEDMFRTLLIENSDPHFRRKMLETAGEIAGSAFRVPLPAEYQQNIYIFLVSGSIEVISDWIAGGCVVPEQALSDILYAMCEGAIGRILRRT